MTLSKAGFCISSEQTADSIIRKLLFYEMCEILQAGGGFACDGHLSLFRMHVSEHQFMHYGSSVDAAPARRVPIFRGSLYSRCLESVLEAIGIFLCAVDEAIAPPTL